MGLVNVKTKNKLFVLVLVLGDTLLSHTLTHTHKQKFRHILEHACIKGRH